MAQVYDGYNDAWETPGWTAQNMAYPPPGTPIDIPVLPYVTVSGKFTDDEGRALESRVVAIPSKKVVSANGVQYLLETRNLHVTRGFVSFPLPVGDWTWTIRQRLGPLTFVNEGLQPTSDLDLSSLSSAPIYDGGGPDEESIYDGGGPDADYSNTTTLDGGAL